MNSNPNDIRPKADVEVVNHGSLYQFYLETDAAIDWWIEHVPDEGFQHSATVKVVEPRYAVNIVQGMQEGGLIVQ
jgi:hypothetical protein